MRVKGKDKGLYHWRFIDALHGPRLAWRVPAFAKAREEVAAPACCCLTTESVGGGAGEVAGS